MKRRLPPIAPETEAHFQKTIIQLARLHGWAVSHFRAVRVSRSDGTTYHQTPVAADGKGWPDLVLVRHTILFREIKTRHGRLTPEQLAWGQRITQAGGNWKCWRPQDWDEIVTTLTHYSDS